MATQPYNGFNHSVPVPRIYKTASKIARNVKEGKGSVKNLVFQEKHANIKTLYALIVETFKRDETITNLIEKSKLFENETRFEPWLAKILICEMLWGKNKMVGDSKPVQIIRSYEKKFRKILSKSGDGSIKNLLNHNIVKPRYVRVNTLKITVEEAINNFVDEGWTLIQSSKTYEDFLQTLNNLQPGEFMLDLHIPELLIFPPKTEFYRHEAYKSRNIILQDKASCLPVHLLNPSSGSTVLDMCAAPGMKTTQLAAILKNKGTVYAIELSESREKLLKEFVESVGATCVKSVLKDVMKVKNNECPDVEYILVDPSCSGSGITDRVEVENLDFSDKAQRLRKLSNFQAKLLRHALNVFPKAKRIVYSTCSMNAEENEDVVRQVLETSKYFKLINAKNLLESWNESSSEIFPELGNMCVYATPEKDKTNGFFIAVFERLKDGEKNRFLNVELCKMFDRNKDLTKNEGQTEFGKIKEYEKHKDRKKKHMEQICNSDDYVKLEERNMDQTKTIEVKTEGRLTKNKRNKENIEDSNMEAMSIREQQLDSNLKNKKRQGTHEECQKNNRQTKKILSEVSVEEGAGLQIEIKDTNLNKHKKKKIEINEKFDLNEEDLNKEDLNKEENKTEEFSRKNSKKENQMDIDENRKNRFQIEVSDDLNISFNKKKKEKKNEVKKENEDISSYGREAEMEENEKKACSRKKSKKQKKESQMEIDEQRESFCQTEISDDLNKSKKKKEKINRVEDENEVSNSNEVEAEIEKNKIEECSRKKTKKNKNVNQNTFEGKRKGPQAEISEDLSFNTNKKKKTEKINKGRHGNEETNSNEDEAEIEDNEIGKCSKKSRKNKYENFESLNDENSKKTRRNSLMEETIPSEIKKKRKSQTGNNMNQLILNEQEESVFEEITPKKSKKKKCEKLKHSEDLSIQFEFDEAIVELHKIKKKRKDKHTTTEIQEVGETIGEVYKTEIDDPVPDIIEQITVTKKRKSKTQQ